MNDMKNEFANYFSIDWEKTSDNLRNFLYLKFDCDTYGYVEAASFALNKSKRALQYWLDQTDKRNPSIADLVLFAKFFDVSLDDLIEIKGNPDESFAGSLLEEHFDALSQSQDEKEEIELEFASTVLLNEVKDKEHPIKSLYDLILYLPLIPKEVLNDSLSRIQGDVYHGRDYVLEQMSYCYREIDDEEAKAYADSKRKYLSPRPSVYEMTVETRDKGRIEAYKEWEDSLLNEMKAFRQFWGDSPCDNEALVPPLAYLMALSKYTSTTLFGAETSKKAEQILEKWRSERHPD